MTRVDRKRLSDLTAEVGLGSGSVWTAKEPSFCFCSTSIANAGLEIYLACNSSVAVSPASTGGPAKTENPEWTQNVELNILGVMLSCH